MARRFAILAAVVFLLWGCTPSDQEGSPGGQAQPVANLGRQGNLSSAGHLGQVVSHIFSLAEIRRLRNFRVRATVALPRSVGLSCPPRSATENPPHPRSAWVPAWAASPTFEHLQVLGQFWLPI